MAVTVAVSTAVSPAHTVGELIAGIVGIVSTVTVKTVAGPAQLNSKAYTV